LPDPIFEVHVHVELTNVMSIRVETADGFLLDSWETTVCAVEPSGDEN